MDGLKLFRGLIDNLEGDDRVEAQVVADAFKEVEQLNRMATSVSDRALAHMKYAAALKAAYCLIGRLFLEGRLAAISKEKG